jgi:drug/metabolite transporter (DMT)-like permease
VSAFVSSMVLLAVPVIAALAAWTFLGERIGALQIVGGGVVLLSIAVIIRSTQRAKTEQLMADATVFTEAP